MKKTIFLAVIIAVLSVVSCQKEIDPASAESDFVTTTVGDIVPGQYIVLLNEGTIGLKSANMSYDEKQVASRYAVRAVLEGASVTDRAPLYSYSSTIEGFTVQLSPEEVDMLNNSDRVKRIWPDRYFSLGKPVPVPPTPPAQSVPYGVTRVGYASYTGTKVAWIIDTGIDLNHPDLNVNASRGKTFVLRTTTPEDDNGHGTHCAGIVAAIDNAIGVVGVAAGAQVIPIKVLDKRGSGTMSAIIAGVDYVAANGAAGDVANMSLGGGAYDPLDLAVIALGAKGIFVSLAAGNESTDASTKSPARANGLNVYTISACDINDNWAYFSNYGNPPVDYCAPGVSIYSTIKGDTYGTMSGTSMAAPHVAGLLLLTNGNLKTDGYVNGDPDGNPDPIAHK